MPQSVIRQVHYLALKDKMPLLRGNYLIFERLTGIPLDDDALDEEAFDLLAGYSTEDDIAYNPISPQPDVPLIHAAPISLNELQAPHQDRVDHDLLSDNNNNNDDDDDDDDTSYSSSDLEEDRSDSDDSDSDDDDFITNTNHVLPHSNEEYDVEAIFDNANEDTEAVIDE